MALRSDRRVAIVTGAGSGMGASLAERLVQEGWNVACVDINEDQGQQTAEKLGPNAKFFHADVAKYSSQATMFDAVWNEWHRLDALCANAGIVDRSSVYILNHKDSHSMPPEPNLTCTDVVFKGVVYGTQLATHFMRRNQPPGGKIIATASVVSLYPHSTYPEYSGAKAGVLQFMRTAGPILKLKDNIDFNAVLPGIVPTTIIPQTLIDAVGSDYLTPISTVVKAYMKLLNDDSLYGQAIECSVDRLLFAKQPEYLDGPYSKRATTVWEPLFKMMHFENSGLPEAVP